MGPDPRRVSAFGPGGLYVMAKPSSDFLADDVSRLRALGLTSVVSMLEPSEARSLGLDQEQLACQAAGLTFRNLPVPDRGVPDDPESFVRQARELVASINGGENLVVHCRAGIGRTGMLAALMLALDGAPVEDAFQTVSDARGVSVPDTDAQKEWVVNAILDSAFM